VIFPQLARFTDVALLVCDELVIPLLVGADPTREAQ
jgi:hypothetical protein